ncbi:MAG TPA: DNA polymerase III, partial [Dongiaceae bacterium]|nr:DNA polymerase III [Dongiaceae bacterium]
IVASPLGTLVLLARTDLPVGGVIVLEVAATPPAAATTPDSTAAEPQRSLLGMSRGWPALTEAAEVLGRAGPEASAELARQLPQAGPRLAAGLISLLAALAAGDADRWLAPALRLALERAGRADLANRLRGEFRQAAGLAAEPIGGDWRVAYLPLHDGAELRQINLYLRGHRRPRGAAAESDSPTRFILEVELSRLGPLQLDGLVNRRRFDLMLRSRTPLSASMRRDIEAIFDEARAVAGFAGAIAFQAAATFPVAPLEEAAGKSVGVVV